MINPTFIDIDAETQEKQEGSLVKVTPAVSSGVKERN